MLRNVMVALAIVLVLGSSAFARGSDYGGGGDGFRGSHFGGGLGGTPGNHAGYGNRASGLRAELRGYGSRDVGGLLWAHDPHDLN